MFSGSLMNSTFAVVVLLLLGLKTIEMAFHTYTCTTAVNRVRTWPITDVIQRLHLGHIFRLPLLVLALSVLLAWCELPVWLSVTGVVLILGALWVQLIEAPLSRLVFGYSDIAFRRVSLPEARARCGNSARRCGGCRVTGIPTATGRYGRHTRTRKPELDA